LHFGRKYSAYFFARAPGKTFFRERRFGVSSVQKMALQGTHIAHFYRKTHYELQRTLALCRLKPTNTHNYLVRPGRHGGGGGGGGASDGG